MINFLINGGAVKRFHTTPTLQTNTVAHHSHGVAMLLWLLTNGTASADLLMAGLTHDLGEQVIGDIPAPAKREVGPAGMEGLNLMERAALAGRGMAFPLSPEDGRLLKIADCMDGMLFCISERRLGNESIVPILVKFDSYIRALNGDCGAIYAQICEEWRVCDESK